MRRGSARSEPSRRHLIVPRHRILAGVPPKITIIPRCGGDDKQNDMKKTTNILLAVASGVCLTLLTVKVCLPHQWDMGIESAMGYIRGECSVVSKISDQPDGSLDDEDSAPPVKDDGQRFNSTDEEEFHFWEPIGGRPE